MPTRTEKYSVVFKEMVDVEVKHPGDTGCEYHSKCQTCPLPGRKKPKGDSGDIKGQSDNSPAAVIPVEGKDINEEIVKRLVG